MGMRRGYESGWLENDNKQIMAVNLGSDFTAEHEWGIKELNQILGVDNDENVMGIERYRVKNPQMDGVLLIEENKSNAALIVVKPYEVQWLKDKKLDDISGGELRMYTNVQVFTQEIATAWCGSQLGIRVKRPTNIKKLKRIYKAIQDKDAAVWLGGAGVFKNAGLMVGIISAIPDDKKKEILNSHLEYAKLQAASKKAGIKERIDALNAEFREKNQELRGYYEPPFGYYALRAAWIAKGRNSKHPVMYWLNPMEQKKHQSNWYTVEELEQWIDGKGPVFKEVKEEKKTEKDIVLAAVLSKILK